MLDPKKAIFMNCHPEPWKVCHTSRYEEKYRRPILSAVSSAARACACCPSFTRSDGSSINLLRELIHDPQFLLGTRIAAPDQFSRKLGMSLKTRAQPAPAASSTAMPNGS